VGRRHVVILNNCYGLRRGFGGIRNRSNDKAKKQDGAEEDLEGLISTTMRDS
jgi:hypothetical protein